MRATLGHLSTVVLTVCLVSLGVQKLCEFHAAYQLQQEKIEREAWFRVQCSKPDFYTNLRYHTDLCETIEATARIGAAWHALRAICITVPLDDLLALAHRVSWPVLAATAVVCLFFPSAIITHMRYKQARLPLYESST